MPDLSTLPDRLRTLANVDYERGIAQTAHELAAANTLAEAAEALENARHRLLDSRGEPDPTKARMDFRTLGDEGALPLHVEAVLTGPEHFDVLRGALERLREGGWATPTDDIVLEDAVRTAADLGVQGREVPEKLRADLEDRPRATAHRPTVRRSRTTAPPARR